METGISTAVLKGANAPVAKDANGEVTGSDPSVVVTQGDSGYNADALAVQHESRSTSSVAVQRCTPPSDVVVRGEAR